MLLIDHLFYYVNHDELPEIFQPYIPSADMEIVHKFLSKHDMKTKQELERLIRAIMSSNPLFTSKLATMVASYRQVVLDKIAAEIDETKW